jgi:hypothetical protein
MSHEGNSQRAASTTISTEREGDPDQQHCLVKASERKSSSLKNAPPKKEILKPSEKEFKIVALVSLSLSQSAVQGLCGLYRNR